MKYQLKLNNGDLLEMKAIKHAEFASQETNCYEASLYLNNKRIAWASNSGRGEDDLIDYDYENYDRDFINVVREQVIETLPERYTDEVKEKYGFSMDKVYESRLEDWCTDMVDLFVQRKSFDRYWRNKKKVLFIKNNEIFTVSVEKSDRSIALIQERHPDGVILNSMDKESAWELWHNID